MKQGIWYVLVDTVSVGAWHRVYGWEFDPTGLAAIISAIITAILELITGE